MMEDFLARYGYPALFGGTLVEGDTFILLAGFLAHRGYFDLLPVLAIAAGGAFAGDVAYFFMGRHYGRPFIMKRKRAAAAVPRLEDFMHRHSTLFLFLVRYVWGIRWAAASLTGASKMAFARFALIDLAACMVWAGVVGSLGYVAGEAIERVIADVKRYELVGLGGLAILGVVYACFWYRRGTKLSKQPP